MACLECVAVCPAEGALNMSLVAKRRVPAWAIAAGVATIFLGAVAYAHWTGYWRTGLPDNVYLDLIPRAQEFRHP
jgi:ferredoxin